MMKNQRLIAGLAMLAALWATTALAADQQAYMKACAAAEEARKMAVELKFEWNTIEPLIAKAGEAASAGDYDKAVKLCEEARRHGEASVAQAKHEADAWRAAVVK
jgi:hypothetical protein